MKYNFNDILSLVKNNGIDGANSYIKIHGCKVYTQKTLIRYIEFLSNLIIIYSNLFNNQNFNKVFNEAMRIYEEE